LAVLQLQAHVMGNASTPTQAPTLLVVHLLLAQSAVLASTPTQAPTLLVVHLLLAQSAVLA
jgi:hypothetical protein